MGCIWTMAGQSYSNLVLYGACNIFTTLTASADCTVLQNWGKCPLNLPWHADAGNKKGIVSSLLLGLNYAWWIKHWSTFVYYVNNMPKIKKPKSSKIQFLIVKHKLSFKDIKGHITKPKLNNLVSADRQLESKSNSYLLQSSPYLVESTLWDGIFSGLVNLLIKVHVWFLFCSSS